MHISSLREITVADNDCLDCPWCTDEVPDAVRDSSLPDSGFPLVPSPKAFTQLDPSCGLDRYALEQFSLRVFVRRAPRFRIRRPQIRIGADFGGSLLIQDSCSATQVAQPESPLSSPSRNLRSAHSTDCDQMADPSTSNIGAGPSTSRAPAVPPRPETPASPTKSVSSVASSKRAKKRRRQRRNKSVPPPPINLAPAHSTVRHQVADPSASNFGAGPSTSRDPAIPPRPETPTSPTSTVRSTGSKGARKKQRQRRNKATRKALGQELDFKTPAQECKPVANLPGITSCPELAQWGLAVATDWNFLCCTKCDKADRIVNFVKVREHVKKHIPTLDPKLTSEQMKDVCRKYGVVQDNPKHVQTPLHGLAPIEVLPVSKLFKCAVCEDADVDTYLTRGRSRRRHHSEVHGNFGAEHTYCDREVDVQTFAYARAKRKKWFEVNPKLLKIRKLDLDHGDTLDIGREATAEEMAKAYRALAAPRAPAPVQVDDLRDVMPLLHVTGFSHHVGNRTKELRKLVEYSGGDDPHASIFAAAEEIWDRDQGRIPDIFDPWKELLVQDESGKPAGMFMPLSPSTSESYGQLWGRWVVFICRLRQRMIDEDDSYPVQMTDEQITWADHALAYCAKSPDRQFHKHQILYRLSAAFWRPMHEGYYDALAADKFSDPTVRFACLINIRESGEFSTPSNVCHELVRMKYVMRQALYFWSENHHTEAKRSLDGLMDTIQHAISRRRVSPFSIICSWASHASSYTHTTVALPSVAWTGEDSLSVHGYQISVSQVGARIAAELRALDTLVNEHCLLGLTPESLGFNITEETQIADDLGKTDVDYSMFSDPQLDDLRERLGQAFATHEPASFMINRIGVHRNFQAMFKYDGCAKWLDVVNLVNKKIMLLLHMTGGQSGRGTEVVGIRYLNTAHRRRGLYMVAPGLMAMIMFYSKMSSQTGRDRVIGHAVPWALARLILIHRALILPLASAIKAQMASDILADNMLSLVCTVNGKPVTADQIGSDLQTWFLQMCGHPIRWRTFRHLQIAICRRLMPGAYRTLQRVLNILDAQAGHTSEVADEHYAVEAGSNWVIEHDTLYKYIVVSSWWWRIIFKNDTDMLTPREARIGRQAETELPRLDTLHPDALPHCKEDIIHALAGMEDQMKSLVAEVKEVRQLLANFQNRVTTSLDDMLAATKHIPPRAMPDATRAAIKPVKAKHLLGLQLFCNKYGRKNDDVIWTSPFQAQGLIHTLERLTSLLIVLPTGGGKSLTFGAPQYIQKGVTVVIFPLRAVMIDQITASIRRDPRRRYMEYRSGLDVDYGVVVIQIDKVDRDFLSWCQVLRSRNRLARIVLDESHLVLTQENFRPCMRNVKPLIEAGVPLVCLTATLPPSHEEELREHLGGPSWKIIRSPTQRPNLSLRFAKYRSQSDAFKALDLVLERYNEHTMPKKSGILIIVPWTALADKISQTYGIPVYHGGKKGQADHHVVDWVAGKFLTIVGTTGLGTGVDKDLCLMVIHFGLPYGMMSYWQECGRAGRKGDLAMCLTIWWGAMHETKEDDYEGMVALQRMLDSTDCRRERISGYFDASDSLTTCFNSMQRCDRCEIELQREHMMLGLGLEEETIVDYGLECLPRGVLPPRLMTFDPPQVEYSQHDRLVPASSPVLAPMPFEPEPVPGQGVNTGDAGSPMDEYFSGEDMDFAHELEEMPGLPGLPRPREPLFHEGSQVVPPTGASVRESTISWSSSPGFSTVAHGKQKAAPEPSPRPEDTPWQVVRRKGSAVPHAESSTSAMARESHISVTPRPPVRFVSPEPPSAEVPQLERLHSALRPGFTIADTLLPDSHARSRSVSGPSRTSATPSTHRRASSSTPGLHRSSTSRAQYPSFVTALDVHNSGGTGQDEAPFTPIRTIAQLPRAIGKHRALSSIGRSATEQGRRMLGPPIEAIEEENQVPIPAPAFAPGGWTVAVQGHEPAPAPAPVPPGSPTSTRFNRYRHEPESPKHRRLPEQDPRAFAARQLQPMNAIGSAVVRDSTAALHARHSLRDPYYETEAQYATFAFPNLLIVRDSMMSWCTYCLVQDYRFTDHDLMSCLRYPHPKDPILPGVSINGKSYYDNRKLISSHRMVPDDSTMCYFCYFPKNTQFGHPPGKTWKECTFKDRLLPIMWFIMQSSPIQRRMAEKFRLREEMQTPETFYRWLLSTDPGRTVNWRGESTTFYFIWYVVLWLVLDIRKWTPVHESLVGLPSHP
ncbi:hypothetical protein FRC12_022450 [Ceratobasidium sp. 428]|nr:hypothetical protein FRC12_022450 [Ceratobasidium sp. 428]